MTRPGDPDERPSGTQARPSGSASPAQAAAELAELARALADAAPLQDILQRALEFAVEFVPGCEEAGVSLVRRGKTVETPVTTGTMATECDQLQEELGEGPCVSAGLDTESTLRIEDMDTELRWPHFAPRAAELGVRSMLACQLATPRDRLGSLNLYSTRAHAFAADSELIGAAYATHVGLALGALDKEQNLRAALQSRELIGQAMGILMERHHVTATQAFDLMVLVSQRSHVKLRDIAEELTRTGALPS